MITSDTKVFIKEGLKAGKVDFSVDAMENVEYQLLDVDEQPIEKVYTIWKSDIDWTNAESSFYRVVYEKRPPRPWEWFVE